MPVEISFPPFRLDAESGRLWRGDEPVALRPKAYRVLCHLAERPGRLVSKDELLDAVWPGTHVSDGVLKVCIRELRQALGDTAREPLFIETLHRRGYRFVGAIELPPEATPAPPSDAPAMVGRETERAFLLDRLARARDGARQIVFVTGIPGIGKTTLLDGLLAEAGQPSEPPWIGRGQCVEQYGVGEAFLPVLEALARLGRGPAGAHVVGLLRQHAPSWLLQLPGLIGSGERDALRREYAGSGRERMLRELVVGLENICAVQPLVLALADLHWSDYSTIARLSAIARGRAGARLLVVGTLRTADALAAGHPLPALVRELRTRQLAVELELSPLDEEAVAAYLQGRFGDADLADRLRGPLYRRTEGNPLFLVNVTDQLVSDGAVARTDGGWRIAATLEEHLQTTPKRLADVLASQLDRLDDAERRTLAAGGLLGQEFATPAVAAALQEDEAAVESRCATLARRGHFLRRLAERTWPDGTIAARYEIRHALYREALVAELTPAARRDIHLRLAERLEAGFRGHETEVATQLALHFERGGDAWRAIRYLHQAGDRATAKHAYGAAVEHLHRALELLEGVEPGPDRLETELVLRVSLGAPLLNSRGFGAPEVEQTYARALELCGRAGETAQTFPVLMGLQAYYASAGELPRAHELSLQVLRLSERVDDRVMRLEANHAMGCDLLRLADLESSRDCLQTALDLVAPSDAGDAYRLTGHDPKTCCLCNLAIATHYLGRPDEAKRLAQEALAWAEEIRLPFSLVQAHVNLAWVHLLRFEPAQAQASCAEALRLCGEYDLLYWQAVAILLDAWALGQAGRLDEACRRADEGRDVARLMGPFVCDAEYRVIRTGLWTIAHPSREGLSAIDENLRLLAERGEHIHRGELERQRGELLLALRDGDAEQNALEARDWLNRALATARAHKTRHLELRIAVFRFLQRDRLGDVEALRVDLERVAAAYAGVGDTLDLRIARDLLAS